MCNRTCVHNKEPGHVTGGVQESRRRASNRLHRAPGTFMKHQQRRQPERPSVSKLRGQRPAALQLRDHAGPLCNHCLTSVWPLHDHRVVTRWSHHIACNDSVGGLRDHRVAIATINTDKLFLSRSTGFGFEKRCIQKKSKGAMQKEQCWGSEGAVFSLYIKKNYSTARKCWYCGP